MIFVEPAPIDRFWNLTSTAWTAIGSIVSAASVIALVAFNWRYLRLTHRQSDAAIKQVELTSQSLEALKTQMADEEGKERHAALAILGETIDVLELWGRRSRTELRTDGNRIDLIPENWGILVSYLSRRSPEMALKAYHAARGLRDAEVELNQWVKRLRLMIVEMLMPHECMNRFTIGLNELLKRSINSQRSLDPRSYT